MRYLCVYRQWFATSPLLGLFESWRVIQGNIPGLPVGTVMTGGDDVIKEMDRERGRGKDRIVLGKVLEKGGTTLGVGYSKQEYFSLSLLTTS